MTSDSNPEKKTLHFYDTTALGLIIGDAAYQSAIESGTHPSDIIPLSYVLGGQVPLPEDKIKPLNTVSWDTKRFVEYTSWLAKVALDDPETKITDNHFAAAHRLGLGPSLKRIDKIGGLSFLYVEANVKNAYKRGLYDSWSREDFASYVGKIARRTPKNESLRDKINVFAKENKGPSAKVIVRRTGSIGNALSMDGLVDANGMDRSDYIDWGVRFYLANDGQPIDTDALEYLSPRRLSPSRSGIVRNFGSLEAFRIEVEPLYQIEYKQKQEEQSKKFNDAVTFIHKGEVPTDAIADSCNGNELVKACSQFLVVNRLLPELTELRKSEIAKMQTKNFVNAILIHGEDTISAADIEEMAEMIGVFSDIWPFDSYMQTLRLPTRL
jgi:hypothetical protein